MKAVFKQSQKCLSCFQRWFPVVVLSQVSAEAEPNTGERNLVDASQDSQCKLSVAASKNSLNFTPLLFRIWRIFNSKDKPP